MDNNGMLTISQLVKKGWSEELLRRISHMPGTPFFRTSARGRFYVIEKNLLDFVKTRRIGR